MYCAPTTLVCSRFPPSHPQSLRSAPSASQLGLFPIGSGRVRHVAARLEPGITAHAFWKVVGQAEGQTQRNTEDQADDRADGHAVDHAEGHAEADPQELPGDMRRRRQESRSVLVGLHTCGDLASTTLRVFHSAGEAVGAVVSVGCCYMHLTEHPLCCDCDEADVTSQDEYAYVTPVEASAIVSPLKGRPSVGSGKERPAGSDVLAGFPMSAHVRQLAIWTGFHTREAACHSLRSYADRLRASAHNGEVHYLAFAGGVCYRLSSVVQVSLSAF